MLHPVRRISTLKTREAPSLKPAKEHDFLWQKEKFRAIYCVEGVPPGHQAAGRARVEL
jgi:hypothetical protein